MKKTTEEFSKEVIDITKGEYKLISEYINNKTKVKLLHIKCNNIYEVRPDRFIQGDRCPKCAKVESYTTKSYKEKVKLISNNEYDFIDNYINNSTKVKFLHYKCNKEFLMTPINFNQGHRCPYCCHPHLKKNIEQLKNEIYEQVKDEYTLISNEYINNKSKLIFKHNTCNKTFISCADNFLNRKRRCPYCARENIIKKHTLTHEQFIAKLDENTLKDYEILSKYTKRKDKIQILHKKCNNIFSMTANEFLSGNRCPKCNISKGEEKIRNWLDNNNFLMKLNILFQIVNINVNYHLILK